MFKCLQITCAKYYELCNINIRLKNCPSSKLARLLDTASKFALFSVSGLKDEKLIKKANLHENWNIQLYSRVFWTFQQNVIKIILIISSYTVSKL